MTTPLSLPPERSPARRWYRLVGRPAHRGPLGRLPAQRAESAGGGQEVEPPPPSRAASACVRPHRPEARVAAEPDRPTLPSGGNPVPLHRKKKGDAPARFPPIVRWRPTLLARGARDLMTHIPSKVLQQLHQGRRSRNAEGLTDGEVLESFLTRRHDTADADRQGRTCTVARNATVILNGKESGLLAVPEGTIGWLCVGEQQRLPTSEPRLVGFAKADEHGNRFSPERRIQPPGRSWP
jgi:hypothetical protein